MDAWRTRRKKRRKRTGRKLCPWNALQTSSVTLLLPVETGWGDTTLRKTLSVSKAAVRTCTHDSIASLAQTKEATGTRMQSNVEFDILDLFLYYWPKLIFISISQIFCCSLSVTFANCSFSSLFSAHRTDTWCCLLLL